MDSAFSAEDNFVPAYKNPRGHELDDEEILFNDQLSKPRSHSERRTGTSKGRFPMLKSMRFISTEEKESMIFFRLHHNFCCSS